MQFDISFIFITIETNFNNRLQNVCETIQHSEEDSNTIYSLKQNVYETIQHSDKDRYTINSLKQNENFRSLEI